MQHNLLINGKLVAGEGEKVPVYNPATGDVILEIAEATAAQVDAAVEAADRAFDAWSQTTPKTRSECLLKLSDAIAAQAETLAQLESLNCGKPLHCVINDEMPLRTSSASSPAPPAACREWPPESISKGIPQ